MAHLLLFSKAWFMSILTYLTLVGGQREVINAYTNPDLFNLLTQTYNNMENVSTLHNSNNSDIQLTTDDNRDVDEEHWIKIFDEFQLALAILGFMANLGTVIALGTNGGAFSMGILILLRHQSIADCFSCLFAAILLLQPGNWVPGIYALDIIICHAWNSQVIYWSPVFISIWNLVFLAYERYLAICRPFQHKDLTRSKLYTMFGVLYLCTLLIVLPSIMQTHLVDGMCRGEYLLEGEEIFIIFKAYSVTCFFVFYIIPCLFFFIFYGLIIITFRKRQKDTELAASRVIDKATSQLTRMSIVVTVIFFITIGYDNWYYMLGNTGIIMFDINSPIQKVAIVLVSVNSACNPLVYGLLVPAYRNAIQKTFCGYCLYPASQKTNQ